MSSPHTQYIKLKSFCQLALSIEVRWNFLQCGHLYISITAPPFSIFFLACLALFIVRYAILSEQFSALTGLDSIAWFKNLLLCGLYFELRLNFDLYFKQLFSFHISIILYDIVAHIEHIIYTIFALLLVAAEHSTDCLGRLSYLMVRHYYVKYCSQCNSY